MNPGHVAIALLLAAIVLVSIVGVAWYLLADRSAGPAAITPSGSAPTTAPGRPDGRCYP